MRLLADRAVGHGAGGEAFQDRLDRLDFPDRHRLADRLQFKQAAQGGPVFRLIVHGARIFLEQRVRTGARGVLQLRDRLRIEQVVLAIAAPLVLAAPVQFRLARRARRVGVAMTQAHFLGDHLDADATDARGSPGEKFVDEILRQTHGLEDLGAAVRLDGGDTDLGQNLEHALVQRLDVVLDRLGLVDAHQQALTDHVIERLEGEVRIDRAGTVTDEQRHVMDLARLAGFDDQPGLHTRAGAHQVMVHTGGGEQGRDRRMLRIHAAIGQSNKGIALVNRRTCLSAQIVHGARQRRAVAGRGVQHRDRDRLESRLVRVADPGQFGVVQDR